MIVIYLEINFLQEKLKEKEKTSGKSDENQENSALRKDLKSKKGQIAEI